MRTLMCCVALMALVTCLTVTAAEEKKAEKKTLTDQEFMTAATAAGLAEVNLSRLAQDRAQRTEVKDFAQQMVRDHTKANDELLKLANSKNLTPAKEMDAKHQALQSELVKLKGDAFDRAYLKAMDQDHAEAIILFEAAHLTVPDKDLKAFAAKTLAIIKVHDIEVKGLCKDLKDINRDRER